SILCELHGALESELRQEQLLALLEADLAPTLPALASIEAEGIRVGAPGATWQAMIAAQVEYMRPLMADVARTLRGGDPGRATSEELLAAVKRRRGLLPPEHFHPSMKA